MKRIQLRRRREAKTDYKARKALLESGLPRLVIRKSNKYILAQLVESKEAQDFVLASVHSKQLKDGSGCFKNLPAAYLVGLWIGKKAKEKGIKKAIPDFGLYRSTKGSKLYAVLGGALENGLEIHCDPEMLPAKERLEGKFDVEKIKEKLRC